MASFTCIAPLGKTTLLDVLSRRTSQGRWSGDILVNGASIRTIGSRYSNMVGFCTQQDTHLSTATVHESLLFSARLRLPSNIPDDIIQQHVIEVMDVMELGSLSHRLVGDTQSPGLSPGELKRLTIAVELVANPSILFL